jgi:DNA-directed RNA polymerase specialized sigma24 family protein
VIDLTDKELMQYRRLTREAEELQGRIDKLYDKEITTGHSIVKGSCKHFPYTPTAWGVWIDDPKEVAARDKLIAVYQDRLKQAEEEILKVEQFISEIPDSEIRMIFQYRYIDGKKLREIGELLNRDWSGIGKKIHDYLNFPTIPQK